jgi:hypothetical protein
MKDRLQPRSPAGLKSREVRHSNSVHSTSVCPAGSGRALHRGSGSSGKDGLPGQLRVVPCGRSERVRRAATGGSELHRPVGRQDRGEAHKLHTVDDAARRGRAPWRHVRQYTKASQTQSRANWNKKPAQCIMPTHDRLQIGRALPISLAIESIGVRAAPRHANPQLYLAIPPPARWSA